MDCDACGYEWAAVHPVVAEYLECPVCHHMTPAPFVEGTEIPMKRKFRDFRCFGGWLTVKWRPRLLVWWSKDATPPSNSNPGIWIVGSWFKYASCDDV